MSGRLRLKRVEATAFRGASEKLRIPLDRPLNIVYGPNGSGKSTLTTAIEWALFPVEMARLRDSGIDERRNWEVRHVHGRDYPDVVLTLDDAGTEISLRQYGRRGSGPLPAVACTYADFKHLVYVHQETLRGFLVGKPGPRQDAFSRLLGAGWAQDLVRSLAKARSELRCDEADRKVAELENRLAAKMSEVGHLLREEKRRAREQGLAEPSRSAASRIAGDVKRMIEDLCAKASIPVPELPGSTRDYEQRLAVVLQNLRRSGPGRQQGELAGRRARLAAAGASYAAAKQERDGLSARLAEMPNDSERRLNAVKEEGRALRRKLTAMSQRRSVVVDAIEFFKLEPETTECPVCEQPISPSLPEEIQARFLAAASAAEARLREEIGGLARDSETLTQQAEQRRRLATAVERTGQTLTAESTRLEQALGREVRSDEDPLAVARLALEELDGRLAELQRALDSWLERIAGIETEARKMEFVTRILRLESRLERLAAARQTPEWEDMVRCHRELSQREQQMRLAADSVGTLAHRVASVNLDRVRQPISLVYSHLTARSDFDSVAIDPEKKYEVGIEGDGASVSPTAVLNLTDLNSLAMAVIAGMATTLRETIDLDFLILDDPSQGMDEDVADRLAEVLGELSSKIQIVVATPDPNLLQGLMRSPRQKNVIRLAPRDPAARHPSVRVASIER